MCRAGKSTKTIRTSLQDSIELILLFNKLWYVNCYTAFCCHYFCLFIFVNLTQTKIICEEGKFSEKKIPLDCPHRQAGGGVFSRLMADVEGIVYCGPYQNQAEQALGSKLVIIIPHDSALIPASKFLPRLCFMTNYNRKMK